MDGFQDGKGAPFPHLPAAMNAMNYRPLLTQWRQIFYIDIYNIHFLSLKSWKSKMGVPPIGSIPFKV